MEFSTEIDSVSLLTLSDLNQDLPDSVRDPWSGFRHRPKLDLAEERIREWLKDTSQKLDLTNLNLHLWPNLLKGKEHLIKILDISNNYLDELVPPRSQWCMVCTDVMTWESMGGDNDIPMRKIDEHACPFGCDHNILLGSFPILKECVWLKCDHNPLVRLPELPRCEHLIYNTYHMEYIPYMPKIKIMDGIKTEFRYRVRSGSETFDRVKVEKHYEHYASRIFHLSDWKKIWKIQIRHRKVQKINGVKKALEKLKVVVLRKKIKEEILWSPNHIGKFYKKKREFKFKYKDD